MIGVRCAPSVVHILLSHVELEVDDIEWVVTRMKAEAAAELTNESAGLSSFFVRYIFLTHSDLRLL